MAIVNYLSVDFTVSPRIIWIDTTSSTSISVQNLIDTCMHISALGANMDDAILLESSGKEYLVADGSVKVGLTVTLNNAKIAFKSLGGPDWVLCSIEGGNVVTVEDIYTSPRVYIPVVHPTPFITIERVSSSSATLSELEAIQYASYGGGVSIDITSSNIGTAYPVGNKEYPVNNLTDAVSIANSKGFDTLFINKSMTLDSGTDITNFDIIGKSSTNTHITIDPSAICNNISIRKCNITGTLDGGTTIHNCYVGDLTYVNGEIHSSGLYGTIILGGNKEAVLINCYTYDQDSPLIIDMGGSGQDLSMPDYSGLATIRNLDSTSEEIGIGLDAGMVVLEDTITAGTIIISGIGMLMDYSTGVANVNTDGLMSKQTITEISWDAIYIDSNNGESGTTFPIGTASNPSNNIIDACIIASNNSIKTIKLRGSISLSQVYNGWTFIGVGSIFSDTINLNGYNITGCRFDSLTITGTMTGSNVQFVECNVKDVSGINALVMNSSLQGNITMGGIGSVLTGQNIGVRGNSIGTPAVIDMVGTGRSVQVSMDGAIQFSNAVAGSAIEIGLNNGAIILDPTCTGGVGLFTGVGNLINYSTMTITNSLLNEPSIAAAVADEDIIKSIDKKTKLIPGLM